MNFIPVHDAVYLKCAVCQWQNTLLGNVHVDEMPKETGVAIT